MFRASIIERNLKVHADLNKAGAYFHGKDLIYSLSGDAALAISFYEDKLTGFIRPPIELQEMDELYPSFLSDLLMRKFYRRVGTERVSLHPIFGGSKALLLRGHYDRPMRNPKNKDWSLLTCAVSTEDALPSILLMLSLLQSAEKEICSLRGRPILDDRSQRR